MCPVPRWQLGEESKADLDVGEGLVGLVEAAGDVGEEQHGQLLVRPLGPPETRTRPHSYDVSSAKPDRDEVRVQRLGPSFQICDHSSCKDDHLMGINCCRVYMQQVGLSGGVS